MADTVAAVTGCSMAEAEQFLAMAGGNAEAAIGLYFEMGAAPPAAAADSFGSGSGGGEAPAAPAEPADPALACAFPPIRPFPPAWREQVLVYSDEPGQRGLLLQTANGPCGVLAALNAQLLVEAAAGGPLNPAERPLPGHLVAVLVDMLDRCRPGPEQPFVFAEWVSPSSAAGSDTLVAVPVASRAEATAYCEAHLESLSGAGACLLLVASLAWTRGAEQLRQDMHGGGAEPGQALLLEPFWLCSSEVLSLMLRGTAVGNVGAYHPLTQEKQPWVCEGGSVPTAPVGMLSFDEISSGITLADDLKRPSLPIWLLHGGDHLTLLLSTSAEPLARPVPGSEYRTLLHWNGLPPNRAARALTLVPADAAHGGPMAPLAAPAKKDTFIKDVPGEIAEIVQARPDDKKARPEQWKTWSFEFVLAVDDPSVEGGERPPDMPPPVLYEQGPPPAADQPWRCAACYRERFKTMCFGQNDAGAAVCRHCGKPPAEAGFSLWRPYAELPPHIQHRLDRRWAPKILTLLRTLWPAAQVSWEGDRAPSV